MDQTTRRRDLHRRDPCCHWCHAITVLNSSWPPTERPDPYLATVDHLQTRAAGRRGSDLHNTVLACYRCNKTRNVIEQRLAHGWRVDMYPDYLVASVPRPESPPEHIAPLLKQLGLV